MFRHAVLSILTLAVLCAGCGKPARSAGAVSSGAHTNRQIFEVKGLVLSVTPKEKSILIKHEEVAGYMRAMTMPFDVKDTNDLAGIEAGDPVVFRLTVTDTAGWIDQIRKTGPKTNDLPVSGPFRFVRDVEALKPGDPLPEYRFTNQFGEPFSTGSFKGRALAITFLFTRCPYPSFCPRMADHFEEVQNRLLALPSGQTNWHLLTLSFDPAFDTPAVLKSYAQSHRYDPARWTFATGALIDITAIGEQFGFEFARSKDGGIDHNLRTAVIDASGRVRKIFAGNQWQPAELADEIVSAARPNDR